MEAFIEYIKFLNNTMSFKVFITLYKEEASSAAAEANLYIKWPRAANAKGIRVSDGFVLLFGSTMVLDVIRFISRGLKTLRDELIESEIVAYGGEELFFKEDYLFSSPSTAAEVILGRNCNRLIE